MSKVSAYHMVHPGPVHPKRVEWARGDLIHAATEKRTSGASLRDSVADLVQQTGKTSGTGRFRGSFSRFRFTTGGPARDGKAANYTFIRDVDEPSGPVDVRFTVGLNEQDECHVHAHCEFVTQLANGEQGGHLFPDDCIIERHDLLEVSLVDGLLLRQIPDPETLHSVFEIETGGTEGNGLFVRLRPNEDLVEALSHLLPQTEARAAHTINSIGSLNAPAFVRPVNEAEQIPSVGMEITAMEVVWTNDNDHCTVNCSTVDETGRLHRGRLAFRVAPICVTGEILLDLSV